MPGSFKGNGWVQWSCIGRRATAKSLSYAINAIISWQEVQFQWFHPVWPFLRPRNLIIAGYIARGTAYCQSLAYALCVMHYLGILLPPNLSSSKNPCIMTYMQYYLMHYEIVNCMPQLQPSYKCKCPLWWWTDKNQAVGEDGLARETVLTTLRNVPPYYNFTSQWLVRSPW